jgi:hypothetical protein
MLQIATSKTGRGGRCKLPHVFTEHGAIMASIVLSSERAVQMSVYVVRAQGWHDGNHWREGVEAHGTVAHLVIYLHTHRTMGERIRVLLNFEWERRSKAKNFLFDSQWQSASE